MINKDTIIRLAREADWHVGVDGYINSRVEAAMKAAYKLGLEDAADRAIDIVAMHGGSVEIEAHIRQELKDTQ